MRPYSYPFDRLFVRLSVWLFGCLSVCPLGCWAVGTFSRWYGQTGRRKAAQPSVYRSG
ncbi:hypothetical protein [Porphyromonas gingivalis]|uniref:hypothetical protein n=1 Tax=Porphyromonas gingivalis TaxID=837 RepID=UPI0012BC4E3A|nr:hypothetical protein [Porphyromonas gingivalis]